MADDDAKAVCLLLTSVFAGNNVGASHHRGKEEVDCIQPSDEGGVARELQN